MSILKKSVHKWITRARGAGPGRRGLASDWRRAKRAGQHHAAAFSTLCAKAKPHENVWEYPRANKLCNLVWDTYDVIVEARRKAWDFLINDPERIRSIGTRDWASVSG